MSHTVEPYSSLSPMLYPALSLLCCSVALQKKKVRMNFDTPPFNFPNIFMFYLNITPSLPQVSQYVGKTWDYAF